MKKLYLLILAISFITQGNAQNPELFNNTWYLTQLVSGGISYSPPSNSEVAFIPLTFDGDGTNFILNTSVCNSGWTSASVSPTNIIFGDFASTLIECAIPSNNFFEGLYFGFFWNHGFEELTYSLSVTGLDENLAIISPSNGDVAYYSNQQLGTTKFEQTSIKIFPNPAQDVITIGNLNGVFKSGSIEIYNILGNLCHSENFNGAPHFLNVHSLAPGNYIIKISGDSTVVTQRFVKI